MVGLVVIKTPFLSLRTLGICCLVLLAGGVSIMSRLLCLKNVALCCVSVSFKLVFHWMIHRTTVLAAMRVVVFRGKACLSGSNTSQMLVLFLKYCLCPTPSLCCHVGLRCLNLISFLTQSSHQQAAKDYKTEEL